MDKYEGIPNILPPQKRYLFVVRVELNYDYNAFNVYRRELAPGTVSLTGDRAQGDDSKHWAYSN